MWKSHRICSGRSATTDSPREEVYVHAIASPFEFCPAVRCAPIRLSYPRVLQHPSPTRHQTFLMRYCPYLSHRFDCRSHAAFGDERDEGVPQRSCPSTPMKGDDRVVEKREWFGPCTTGIRLVISQVCSYFRVVVSTGCCCCPNRNEKVQTFF